MLVAFTEPLCFQISTAWRNIGHGSTSGVNTCITKSKDEMCSDAQVSLNIFAIPTYGLPSPSPYRAYLECGCDSTHSYYEGWKARLCHQGPGHDRGFHFGT